MLNCFFCDHENAEKSANDAFAMFGIKNFNCPVCGQYGIYDDFYKDFQSGWNQEKQDVFRLKASMLAVERKLAGKHNYVICDNNIPQGQIDNTQFSWLPVDVFLDEYPKNATEIYDRVLLNLSRCVKHPCDDLQLSEREDAKYLLFSQSTEQIYNLILQLTDAGYINSRDATEDCLPLTSCITTNGWDRISTLQSIHNKSDSTFIAMWFSSETEKYRECVQEAVRRAGFKPVIVDQEHFNDYIMDKVTNDIKAAEFIIADFTCMPEENVSSSIKGGVRGGVYYEAGYAKGLGKEVIHTCHDDDESKKRMHFDVAQISTIFWKENDSGGLLAFENNFIDVVKQRIIATVGRGPIEYV
jgi:nucleoside 2-deoxyribosyltransferase